MQCFDVYTRIQVYNRDDISLVCLLPVCCIDFVSHPITYKQLHMTLLWYLQLASQLELLYVYGVNVLYNFEI